MVSEADVGDPAVVLLELDAARGVEALGGDAQVGDQEGDRPEPERAPDAAVEREQPDDDRGRERHHPQERGGPAVHPGAAHATPLPTNHTAIAAIPTANARA